MHVHVVHIVSSAVYDSLFVYILFVHLCILGGLLIDRLFRDIDSFGVASTIIYTIVSVMAVYSTAVSAMSLLFFIQGILVTVIDVCK